MQHFTPGKGQRNEDDDDGQAGDDRSAQHLVDRIVDHGLFVLPPAEAQVFPDPVKDHNRVGERLARQGEERRHDEKSDFLVENVEGTQHRQDVMKGRQRRSDAEPKLEARRDI